jgi:hypothetical protein
MSDTAYDRMIRADRRLTEAIKRDDPHVKIRAYQKDLEDARREWEYGESVNAQGAKIIEEQL